MRNTDKSTDLQRRRCGIVSAADTHRPSIARATRPQTAEKCSETTPTHEIAANRSGTKRAARLPQPQGMSLRTGCGSRPPEAAPNRRTNNRPSGLCGRGGEGQLIHPAPPFSSATDASATNDTIQTTAPPDTGTARFVSLRHPNRPFRRSADPPQQPVRSSAADGMTAAPMPMPPSHRPSPAGSARPRPSLRRCLVPG